MGRAFEFRKERKFKRWGHMARVFTKLGKEITIAVREGGDDVVGNPRLRALIAEAKSENMPKENVERAIKKATDKDLGNYEVITYEGYGPGGIAYLVEAATDNNTRTVANVRSYFTKCNGNLGVNGSVSFMFDHKCVFRVKENPENIIDEEEMLLETIDLGVEEIYKQEAESKDGEEYIQIVFIGSFESYGKIQDFIESNKMELVSGRGHWIPNIELKDASEEDRKFLDKLTDLLEDDDDVTNVYNTLQPLDDEEEE